MKAVHLADPCGAVAGRRSSSLAGNQREPGGRIVLHRWD